MVHPILKIKAPTSLLSWREYSQTNQFLLTCLTEDIIQRDQCE